MPSVIQEIQLGYIDLFSGEAKTVPLRFLEIPVAPEDYYWHCKAFHRDRMHFPATCNWCHRNSVKAAAEEKG